LGKRTNRKGDVEWCALQAALASYMLGYVPTRRAGIIRKRDTIWASAAASTTLHTLREVVHVSYAKSTARRLREVRGASGEARRRGASSEQRLCMAAWLLHGQQLLVAARS
jgi:hypothetical protein